MKRIVSIFTLLCFLTASGTGNSVVYGQAIALPVPGTMVNLSPAFDPVLIKGLKIHPENPFLFDFIIDTGSGPDLSERASSGVIASEAKQTLKRESTKLIKYFLAAMTVPEKDLWVNLSPYEKHRMIAPNLGETAMGSDMLAQDYILKQLTASLIYPEKDLGKTFWDKVYAKARLLYGTAEIPVNTFNKVWIVADRADVFERNNTAFVAGAHLKVMLEEDYLAKEKNEQPRSQPGDMFMSELQRTAKRCPQAHCQAREAMNVKAPQGNHFIASPGAHALASQLIRQIILPQIEEEVNRGENFVPLRQMFYAIILASWYKMSLKHAMLTQIYGNQNKTKVGINQQDPKANEDIFNRYLQAYKKGVFNYIKEESLVSSDSDDKGAIKIPRKYFSGGLDIFQGKNPAQLIHTVRNMDMAMAEQSDHFLEVQAAISVVGPQNIKNSYGEAVPGEEKGYAFTVRMVNHGKAQGQEENKSYKIGLRIYRNGNKETLTAVLYEDNGHFHLHEICQVFVTQNPTVIKGVLARADHFSWEFINPLAAHLANSSENLIGFVHEIMDEFKRQTIGEEQLERQQRVDYGIEQGIFPVMEFDASGKKYGLAFKKYLKGSWEILTAVLTNNAEGPVTEVMISRDRKINDEYIQGAKRSLEPLRSALVDFLGIPVHQQYQQLGDFLYGHIHAFRGASWAEKARALNYIATQIKITATSKFVILFIKNAESESVGIPLLNYYYLKIRNDVGAWIRNTFVERVGTKALDIIPYSVKNESEMMDLNKEFVKYLKYWIDTEKAFLESSQKTPSQQEIDLRKALFSHVMVDGQGHVVISAAGYGQGVRHQSELEIPVVKEALEQILAQIEKREGAIENPYTRRSRGFLRVIPNTMTSVQRDLLLVLANACNLKINFDIVNGWVQPSVGVYLGDQNAEYVARRLQRAISYLKEIISKDQGDEQSVLDEGDRTQELEDRIEIYDEYLRNILETIEYAHADSKTVLEDVTELTHQAIEIEAQIQVAFEQLDAKIKKSEEYLARQKFLHDLVEANNTHLATALEDIKAAVGGSRLALAQAEAHVQDVRSTVDRLKEALELVRKELGKRKIFSLKDGSGTPGSLPGTVSPKPVAQRAALGSVVFPISFTAESIGRSTIAIVGNFVLSESSKNQFRERKVGVISFPNDKKGILDLREHLNNLAGIICTYSDNGIGLYISLRQDVGALNVPFFMPTQLDVRKVDAQLRSNFKGAKIHEMTFIPFTGDRISLEQETLNAMERVIPTWEYDRAQAVLNGGIDLSHNHMYISKDGQGVYTRFDPAMIARIKRDGFDGLEFHIQSIVPITDLPMLLGLQSRFRRNFIAKT